MALDIAQLRRDTPGCENVLHLDYAGSALPPSVVTDAVVEHLRLEARWGGYRAAAHVDKRIEQVYDDVAELVGAHRHEIALVESATRAWQLAFAALKLRDGDRILCVETEYASNHLAFLQARERVQLDIVTIPSNDDGSVDLDALETELRVGAAVVSLTHVPTNGGVVHPALSVARLCRTYDVILMLDACQSAGQVELAGIPWDIVTASGRKYLRGPRGTGFLGVRRELEDRIARPLLDLRGAVWTAPEAYDPRRDARRFELWERSIANVLGLGAAVRYALDLGVANLEARIANVAAALRNRLNRIPGIQTHDLGSKRCGLVTFTGYGLDATELHGWLRGRDVHVSVSRRPSTRLDMERRGLEELVRASVHALTTEAELDRFCELVEHQMRA